MNAPIQLSRSERRQALKAQMADLNAHLKTLGQMVERLNRQAQNP